LESETQKSQTTLKASENKRDELLSKRNTDIDQDLIRTNVDQIKYDIDKLNKQKQLAIENSKSVDVKEPSKYYLEDEHQTLKDEMNGLIVEGRVNAESIERNEKLIKQLEDGQICPTCNRALEDVDHSGEIQKLKDLVTDRNKQKLDENQKIDGELIGLRSQIETLNANIRTFSSGVERLKNQNQTLLEKIETNKELIRKIKVENETQSIFKVYLTVFGKNGISKVILKNMVPLINQELYRLLVDSCHFILELNINERNEVEFIMIDTETRVVKPLASGSGYERTISSLALRSVLTKISSLPKPNIVVMDEVFGKIADENLEMVGEFFKKIKDYFEHIFVISHNPLIRNWSDNLVMVKKENNISSVDFVTPKIS